MAAVCSEKTSKGLDRVCVVGGGPLGSATARHLLDLGASSVVVLDGASSGRTRRRGSHHDGARLIRAADAEGDAAWSARNAASLEAFPALEEASGISFFHGSGALVVGPAAFVARAAAAAEAAGRALEGLDEVATRARFPFLAPGPGRGFACVDAAAGWVDPDAMIRAQFAAARKAHPGKLEVAPCVARSVDVRGEEVVVATDDPGRPCVVADRCVIAAGAHTRGLAGSGLDGVLVSRRTVALLEVSAATARDLARSMPTIKYCFESAPGESAPGGEQSRVESGSVYVLPPVRYDSLGGRWFIKVGGGPNDPMEDGVSSDAIDAWLSTRGDAERAESLARIGRTLMPGIPFVGDGHISKACVTTIGGGDIRVASSTPRVTAVTLCAGKAAGPADAIGREVAAAVAAACAVPRPERTPGSTE